MIVKHAPDVFTRHRMNRSHLGIEEGRRAIVWTLELKLWDTDLRITLNDLNEETTVKSIVTAGLKSRSENDTEVNLELTTKDYQNVEVLFNKEGRSAEDKLTAKVEPTLSLRELLSGSTVFEYPTLFIKRLSS